jgi:hypothetical protein
VRQRVWQIVIVYYMLKHHLPYQELGSDYFAKINAKAIANRAADPLIRVWLGVIFLEP